MEHPEVEASARVVFIGIAGPSGAGKSTLAERLALVLGSPLAPISSDWYNGARVVSDASGKRNYETPESHDLQLLKRDLLSIRGAFAAQGKYPEEVQVGIVKNRRNVLREDIARVATLESSGSPITPVVVEGFLLFHEEFISSFFEVRIWIEVDCEEGLHRRFERRGRQDLRRRHDTIDTFSVFYRDTVWANYLRHRETQLAHVQDALRLDGKDLLGSLVRRAEAHSREVLRAAPGGAACTTGAAVASAHGSSQTSQEAAAVAAAVLPPAPAGLLPEEPATMPASGKAAETAQVDANASCHAALPSRARRWGRKKQDKS